jgi:fumarate reductase flavoprotein subunit
MDFGKRDVIVVGGGIAGMVTANRAAELGLRVAVLEKGSAAKYLCNTRMTGGAFHIGYRDVTTGAERLREGMALMSKGYSDAARTEPLAEDGGRALRWLQDQGVRFVRGGHWEYYRWVMAPPRRLQAGPDWEGRGGDMLLRTLEEKLVQRGGIVVRDCRARALRMEGGRCTGVKAVASGREVELPAKAVVIADGGFQSNTDLLKKHIAPNADRLIQRGGATGRGDGLTMATDAGAATVGLDRFYGHLLCADARTEEKLSPFPFLDLIAATGIVVDRDGRRFADEGLGGIYIANEIALLPDPASAVVIFDQAIWDGPGKEQAVPANPHLANAGGTIHRADDLAGLARLIGVNAGGLAASVAAFNAAVAAGGCGGLKPPRETGRYTPMAITKAPFFGVHICPGITYTTGGIRIDTHSRVLRPDGSAIAGLFAAGTATGGLEGGPRTVYIGGLAMSTVTGMRAAETIAGADGKG